MQGNIGVSIDFTCLSQLYLHLIFETGSFTELESHLLAILAG